MQPNTTIVKSLGDLGGNKIDMKIDANSIEHIMAVLTDLYSDPIAAVVREYSTNAYDSHKESGQTRPIEVTLPTTFDPNFRVKDFGVGLSVNDVENIYSQYGASTKRGTDEQTGMLGLGCKSGLTYSDQFIVNAVKGGVKVSVVVSRTEKGTGVMETLDTVTTDEPNGVEIVIPTRAGDSYKFANIASDFYAYWPKGAVLVDGAEPKRFDEVATVIKVTDDIYLVKGMGDHKIVMGDVAYPVAFDKITFANAERGWNNSWAVVAFVPMGSVNFTPSREQLHMTRLTTNTLKGIGEAFDAAIVKRIEEAVEKCDTYHDAWVKAKEWSDIVKFGNVNITYKGEAIPNEVKIDGIVVRPGTRGGIHRGGGRSFTHNKKSYLFITGFTKTLSDGKVILDSTSSSQRSIISKWLDEVGPYFSEYMLVMEPVDNVWLGDDVVNISWEEIKAATKHLRSASYRQAAGTYPIYDPTDTYAKDMIMPASDKIAWMHYKGENNNFSINDAVKALPGYYIVRVAGNRLIKFNRDFPEVKSVKAVVRETLSTNLPAKTKFDLMADTWDRHTMEYFGSWDASKIRDPAIVSLIDDCNKALKSDWNAKHTAQVATAARFGIVLQQDEAKEKPGEAKESLAGYPLLAVHFNYYGRFQEPSVPRDHIYEYINFIYEWSI